VKELEDKRGGEEVKGKKREEEEEIGRKRERWPF
jgi:hypothetical protein